MDIAVKRRGELVWTDTRDKSINGVTDTKIHPTIRLKGWITQYVCSASSSGSLIPMNSKITPDFTQVIRCSGFFEKQSIKWHKGGNPFSLFKHACFLNIFIHHQFKNTRWLNYCPSVVLDFLNSIVVCYIDIFLRVDT